MINARIVGISGYTGQTLVDILLRHPQVRLAHVSSRSSAGLSLAKIFPQFAGRTTLVCSKPVVKDIAACCEVVFLALPHTASLEFVPQLLKAGLRIVDLSADYRIKDRSIYEQFYHAVHGDKDNLSRAVYGLPEFSRLAIRKANLVANPGCYSTAAILAVAPLLISGSVDAGSIIIDAKSGVSGAGKKIEEAFLFAEANEDFKAYKINRHQHIPEINQILSKISGKKVTVTFVPHLLPVNRGILETVYVQKAESSKFKARNVLTFYKKFYKTEPFVRIRDEGEFPRLKDVVGTNYCDIGVKEEKDMVIIVCVIDNLLKGASGQAVQNMNIMCGYPEKTALL
jgi:N-acetyl-gamma-glutamyl-phosphate reductase